MPSSFHFNVVALLPAPASNQGLFCTAGVPPGWLGLSAGKGITLYLAELTASIPSTLSTFSSAFKAAEVVMMLSVAPTLFGSTQVQLRFRFILLITTPLLAS